MRIARSSKEQNGYKRHRTRPVPVSDPWAHEAPQEPSRDGDRKIKKHAFGFKRGTKKIYSRLPAATRGLQVSRPGRGHDPQLLSASPSALNSFGYSVGWLGGVALRSWEIAVTSCAGAKGFASRTLLGTPLDVHSSE